MFEFHGWLALWGPPEDDYFKIGPFIPELERYIAAESWASAFVDLRPMNGVYYLHFAGYTNHEGGYQKQLRSLLAYVLQGAPGSYGLLYWYDDEDDRPPGRDKFRVIAVHSGAVSDYPDPFLVMH